MYQTKTTKVIPSYTLGTAIISRDFTAHLFRYCDGFRHSVCAKEINPVRQSVIPCVCCAAKRIPCGRICCTTFRNVGLLYVANVLITANLAIHDHGEAGLSVLMDAFQIVLQSSICRRPCQSVVIVTLIGWDIAFFHGINNSLCMRLVECDVVGQGCSAVSGQSNSCRGSTCSRHNTQLGSVKLSYGSGIEPLGSIVFQHFIDDCLHRVIRQVVQLARVRNAVAGFLNCQGALNNSEVSFWHGVGFSQGRASSGRHVLIHIPVECVTLLFALEGSVFYIAKLTELCHRLNCHSQFFRQVVTIHKTTEAIRSPDLSRHGISPLSLSASLAHIFNDVCGALGFLLLRACLFYGR